MSNCCSHGTFLHFSLQSSHLNICYYLCNHGMAVECGQDVRARTPTPEPGMPFQSFTAVNSALYRDHFPSFLHLFHLPTSAAVPMP
eukprot:SM000180S03509  [mRNA]  locus=s180:122826:123887:+ [translate_table: standard]